MSGGGEECGMVEGADDEGDAEAQDARDAEKSMDEDDNDMDEWAEMGPDGEVYTTFRWEGDYPNRERRMLRQGFTSPVGLKIRPMMVYWYCGMPWNNERIRPLKFVCTGQISGGYHVESMHVEQGQGEICRESFEEICRERGVLSAREHINRENVDACYNASFKKLVDRAYDKGSWKKNVDKKSFSQFSCVTFCNVLRKKNMQKNRETEQQVERPRTYAEMLRMDNVCIVALQDDGIGGGAHEVIHGKI
eukprot:766292-Hanusia_phi.AAC.4